MLEFWGVKADKQTGVFAGTKFLKRGGNSLQKREGRDMSGRLKALSPKAAVFWLGGVLLLWGAVRPEAACARTSVAKKIFSSISAKKATKELLVNGTLTKIKSQEFSGWRRFETGYSVDHSTAHTGKACARVSLSRPDAQAGIYQSVQIRSNRLAPLVISGWSKAREVSGSPGSGYSLYVDIIYEDGTPWWGQNVPFKTGTHDWQRVELKIIPQKPIRRLTVYGLFRGHTGTVWFDDFSVQQVAAGKKMSLFDGVLVEAQSVGEAESVDSGRVLIRDAADDSRHIRLVSSLRSLSGSRQVSVPEMQLEVTVTKRRVFQKVWRVDLKVRDLTGRDRALNLYYAVPVNALGWRWWQNIQQWRPIKPNAQYSNVHNCGVGATGGLSRWPFACISNQRKAWALLVTEPRSCRLCYDSAQQEFYVSFDLGLSRRAKHPSEATASVFVAEVAPVWNMRAVAALYYRLLPQCFDQRRVPQRQGNWMAFTKISSVQHPEDFFFAVHEGDNDVQWDNAHGILPFVYIEPASFWMSMPKNVARTYQGVMLRLNQLLKDPKARGHERAWATKLSGLKDAEGRYLVWVKNAPWCNGAVFANDADPDVPEQGSHLNQAHLHFKHVKAALKRAEAHGGLAGVYLDSLEGWGFLADWRPEHWKAADLPLTYDTSTKKPVLLNMMSTYEFTQAIADWMHRDGKLVMANATAHNFPWLANLLDLLGTETNWLLDGKFTPPSPDYMYLKRTLSWHKPYMFLMNTNYDRFNSSMVERYMQRCLFYGMFPGFFSENASSNPYFGNPRWYNRDRHLFKKYLPVIRKVAEAGWEPITLARSSNPKVWVERFGGERKAPAFLTIFNTSTQAEETTLTFERSLLVRAKAARLVNLLDGRSWKVTKKQVRLTLKPEQVLALQLQ